MICRVCHERLQPVELSQVVGAHDDVRVLFVGLPCLACVESHPRRYVMTEFGVRLVRRLLTELNIRATRKSRVLGRPLCAFCRRARRRFVPLTLQRQVKIAMENAPTFDVDIRAPLVQCQTCGGQQALDGARWSTALCAAVTKAFDSVELVY